MWKIGNETAGQRDKNFRAGGGNQSKSYNAWSRWFVPAVDSGMNYAEAFIFACKQALHPFGYQVKTRWEKEYCELRGIPYTGKRGRVKDSTVSPQPVKDSTAIALYINNAEESLYSLDKEKINKNNTVETISTPSESQSTTDPDTVESLKGKNQVISTRFMQIDGIMWKITELARKGYYQGNRVL